MEVPENVRTVLMPMGAASPDICRRWRTPAIAAHLVSSIRAKLAQFALA